MKADPLEFKSGPVWLKGEIVALDRRKKEYRATFATGRSVEARGSTWLLASLICCAKYCGFTLVEAAPRAARRKEPQKTKVQPKSRGSVAKKKTRRR